MKVYLCITPFFPTPDYFVGPYVLDQVKAIERNSNFKVVVMKPSRPLYKGDDYEYDGVKVYHFTDYSLPTNAFPNRICDRMTAHSVIRKLKNIGIELNDIDVCHAHVIRFGAVASILKKKLPHIKAIVQHHGFDVMSVTDGRFSKYAWHKRVCIRHGVKICNSVDLNVGVSNKTLDYVLKQPGICLKNKYVLYNGVDTSKFFPVDKNNNNKIFTIGCVANFWELKDQMTLIRAVEQLVGEGITDIHVVFIGSGYTKAECEAYVTKHNLGKSIEFRKEVMHHELPDFYRNLDLFVLPSYWEAFGCVYTEAYACGTPFVGVKGQGIAELFSKSEADKWLIDKGDYEGLATFIKRYRNKPEPQVLNTAIDFDSLINHYLDYLKNI